MYSITTIQHFVPNQADGTDILTNNLRGKSIVFGISECNFSPHIKDIKDTKFRLS